MINSSNSWNARINKAGLTNRFLGISTIISGPSYEIKEVKAQKTRSILIKQTLPHLQHFTLTFISHQGQEDPWTLFHQMSLMVLYFGTRYRRCVFISFHDDYPFVQILSYLTYVALRVWQGHIYLCYCTWVQRMKIDGWKIF